MVYFGDIKEIIKWEAKHAVIKEGFRNYPIFETWYPKAKFILNLRNFDNWVNSKLGVSAGRLRADQLRILSNSYNMSKEQFLAWLKKTWEEHISKVRAYFVGEKSKKLLEFNIESDNVEKLINFCKPDYNLEARYWKHWNSANKPNPQLTENAPKG